MQDAHQILKDLEEHCGEKLECSHRLRFQIVETMRRMIGEKESLLQGILNIAKGHQTFDPKIQKAISKPKGQ